MSNHDRMTLFDLKEKAKWSTDPEEKKAAIEELSNQGEDAMSELQEIMRITAYEDIKNACAEALFLFDAMASSLLKAQTLLLHSSLPHVEE